MAQMRIGAPLVVMALLIFLAPSSGAQTRELNLGGLIVSVSESRTAQVFHIVDQLSLWDKGTHGGYARWAARNLLLDEADRKLLLQHAELRRARGWGHGFEQAFYVDDSIEVAAQRAVAANLISSNEAAAEKMILLHFAPILSGLLEHSGPQIAAFRTRMATEGKKITPIVKKLIRFSETKETLRVPLFLVSNPEEGSGGGGFNGGKLVVEIQE
jgi:hypothetical protein